MQFESKENLKLFDTQIVKRSCSNLKFGGQISFLTTFKNSLCLTFCWACLFGFFYLSAIDLPHINRKELPQGLSSCPVVYHPAFLDLLYYSMPLAHQRHVTFSVILFFSSWYPNAKINNNQAKKRPLSLVFILRERAFLALWLNVCRACVLEPSWPVYSRLSSTRYLYKEKNTHHKDGPKYSYLSQFVMWVASYSWSKTVIVGILSCSTSKIPGFSFFCFYMVFYSQCFHNLIYY